MTNTIHVERAIKRITQADLAAAVAYRGKPSTPSKRPDTSPRWYWR